MCQNLSIIRLIFSCHFTIYLNKTNFPWPASVWDHIRSAGRWNTARYLNSFLTRLIISIWSVKEIPRCGRYEGEAARGDTDPLGQLPGGSIAGEATSHLVLGHMFLVRNVTMLRYTRNQRGEIYERNTIVAAVWYTNTTVKLQILESLCIKLKHCWWYDICSDSGAGRGDGNLSSSLIRPVPALLKF